MTVKERDPYLCAAGSFFFPGLGQVYCGRILRGIIFLIPAVLMTIPQGLIQWGVLVNWLPYETWFKYLYSFVIPTQKIVDLLVRVIATYDAYRVAKHTHIQQ